MKLAIVSDTHDNLATLEKAVSWMNKNGIEEIIHCGDVCSTDTFQWFAKNFTGKIHLSLGNIDEDHSLIAGGTPDIAKNTRTILHKKYGEVKVNGNQIAFCHYPMLARQLAQTGKYDFVFYGHTHQPWEEKVGACRLINPGNLANLLYKASFAVYDTKNKELKLKILENL